jgi:hypothetical protein
MGLGRSGLVKLRSETGELEFAASPKVDAELLAFLKAFKEPADRARLADFRAMVRSVNEEAKQAEQRALQARQRQVPAAAS